jgi:CotH kinase protein/Secretion system C-terminal sorting domain
MRYITLFFAACLFGFGGISQTLTSSNLPIIIINTNGQVIPDDPKITADMGIIYNGDNVRNNVTDPYNNYNGKVGIEIRGQSSQMFPMKSYSLELRDALGGSFEKSLFGMPKEADWVLYAPYTDKTLMRNFLAYTISNELGRWAAHCRFVEIVINGDYKGIYVFMERIKRGSGRVNIAKMGSGDVAGDAVTGGYIFSLDKEPNGWFSSYTAPNSTNQNKRQFSYVYPKPENIVPSQKDYLKSYVDSFENALASPTFQNKIDGVRKFADLSSFIDYFIVNEVSRNVDGYRLSTFLYKDRDSRNRKIFAGPAWDYDLAFRNANYCDGSKTNGWAYQFNNVCPGDGAGLIPFWWEKLMSDTSFIADLRCRWKEVRKNVISDDHLNRIVDSIAVLTNEARQRHFQRWPILGQYIWPNPNPIPTSYDGEISTLKEWIGSRLFWIDHNIPNAGACEDWEDISTTSLHVEIFPNPTNGTDATIRIKTKEPQTVSLNVFDGVGRLVHTQSVKAVPVSNLVTIHGMNKWQSGIYYFVFSNKDREKISKKVMKH